MTRQMPRPEDVSREHIDAAVISFLKGEREADWTEVSLVTLHPREEIRLVLRENRERYRSVNEGRLLQLLARLRPQGVPYLQATSSFGGGRVPWLNTGAGVGSHEDN